MSLIRRCQALSPGLLLAALSFAPAPANEPDPGASLAQARHQAALKQYEETWTYYQQARIDSYQVYVWSKVILDCRRDMADGPSEQVAAVEDHLNRMKKLKVLIKKIRRLGFGLSYDVGASEYYELEAEHWLKKARPAR